MAEGGWDPDFLSADKEADDDAFIDLDELRHSLPGSHPARPQRRRQPGDGAGQRTREKAERRRRRDAVSSADPEKADPDRADGRVVNQDAVDGRAETATRPIRKVARVAPLMHQPWWPIDRSAGRGAMDPPLTPPPPHSWDHMDGQPLGYLCPSEFPTNQRQALAEARAQPHTTITLPSGPDAHPNLPTAIVNPRPRTPPTPHLVPADPFTIPPFHGQPPIGWPHGFFEVDHFEDDFADCN